MPSPILVKKSTEGLLRTSTMPGPAQGQRNSAENQGLLRARVQGEDLHKVNAREETCSGSAQCSVACSGPKQGVELGKGVQLRYQCQVWGVWPTKSPPNRNAAMATQCFRETAWWFTTKARAPTTQVGSSHGRVAGHMSKGKTRMVCGANFTIYIIYIYILL